MTSSPFFQNFGTMKTATVGKRPMSIEDIEDLKLQAFESGYQAGWDDAVRAQSETMAHVSSEFAASLQSASFEYHELRATMNASVQSIMAEVVGAILPTIAHASLGAHIQEYIGSVARDALDRPIEVTIAPEQEDAVRSTLKEDLADPFKLTFDPALPANQALLRLGQAEAEINLGKTVADISAAVTAFFETQSAEVKVGRSS